MVFGIIPYEPGILFDKIQHPFFMKEFLQQLDIFSKIITAYFLLNIRAWQMNKDRRMPFVFSQNIRVQLAFKRPVGINAAGVVLLIKKSTLIPLVATHRFDIPPRINDVF